MTVETAMRPVCLAAIARRKVGIVPIWLHLRPLTKCKANEPNEAE